MFEYKIKIDKKIISILGPHLYGDTASIIAELISNSYDADADNCWVTIKTGASPEITIEDDGDGMIPEDVNAYFLDIGYNRRDQRPTTGKGRNVFGRKGIGKLAAFSLSRRIELYSVRGGKKAGCILDYDKITSEDKEPETIPDEKIIFDSNKLSINGTGTRLVLKMIKKNINTTYYYLVNRIIRNFNIDFEKFKIHLIKNKEEPRIVNYADLDFFNKMDTIVTIGDEFKDKAEAVKINSIDNKYKKVTSYEKLIKNYEEKQSRFVTIPKSVKILSRSGKEKEINFIFKGWIGTIRDKENLKGLVIKDGATEDEVSSISINDNRITIFSRDRIGEYDILPKVQTDTIYDAYIIGEIHVDIFEDDEFVDMAISNRRGYEETDERYKTLIECLRPLVSYIAQRKADVNKTKSKDGEDDKEKAEVEKIQREFREKSKTMEILEKKLDAQDRKIIEKDNYQFLRAARLSKNTKRIFISHCSDNKQYGFFIMKIFELLGVNIEDTFIFTSYAPTGVPHGQNIYDYLKSCFREDIYVIFLFSKHFYDSNVCIAETGAAWATNRNHSNILIDINYNDIDKPIDNGKQGFRIIDKLKRDEVLKFIKTVLGDIDYTIPSDKIISTAIDTALQKFNDKLKMASFYPQRKYQGHPLCNKPRCGNRMDLKNDGAQLYYECETPGCKHKIEAMVY
jgi:hypothetical protein